MNWQLQVKACSCVTSSKKYPDCLTCDDNLPTSRRTCVVSTVMLLKDVREAWTKSSASVWLRGRRVGQPKHKSSVDTTSRAGKSHAGYWHMQYVCTLLLCVLCNHLGESAISDLYPLICTWMQWPSEHRWHSSAPHRSLLLPPGWGRRIKVGWSELISTELQASKHESFCVSPSVLWAWLCSWQEASGPTRDSLSPAGQLPCRIHLRLAEKAKIYTNQCTIVRLLFKNVVHKMVID